MTIEILVKTDEGELLCKANALSFESACDEMLKLERFIERQNYEEN